MIFFQRTLTSKPLPCDESIFRSIMESPSVAGHCAKIRLLHEQWRNECEVAGKASTKARELHDEKSALKKKLPAFIFQATFPLGRRKQSEAVLNGLYMTDFDDLTPAEMENICCVLSDSEFALCKALGVVLAHVTPSGHGLRLVAKADPGRGNIADNQAWLANKLALPLDVACKDATRISFAFSKNNLLYISNEIFNYNDEEFDKRFGEQYRSGNTAPSTLSTIVPSTAPETVSSTTTETPSEAGDNATGLLATYFRDVPFSHIVAEWWHQQGGEPREGERNVKLHRLAAHLRYICDNREDHLLEVMPSCGLSHEELTQIVHSACQSRMYSAIPRALGKVLEACGLTAEGEKALGVEEDVNLKQLNEEFERITLPPALRAVCSGIDPRIRVGAVLASLPMFFTLLTRIRFDHFDGTESRLSGMTFIIGRAASGKSFIREIDNLLMEPIRSADAPGRKLEQDYRDKRELNKNKKEQQAKPHPVIRITPIQISNTMLAQRMRDAVDAGDPSLHLHVYSLETELATAIRAAKGGAWIEKNDIYCKSFHNELWGMDYANDQAVNGEIEVNLNLVVSGTEDSFDKLIPTSSVLSGLPTRLMYYEMPIERFKMIQKRQSARTEQEKQLLRHTAFALDMLRGKVDARKLTDDMYEWCNKIAQRASLEEDDELDDLRKRTALIGERAGVVFAILQQADSFAQGKPLRFNAQCLRFARFVAEYCLVMQYRKFAIRMREMKKRNEENSGRKGRAMKQANTFNLLPKTFSLDQLQELMPDKNRKAIYNFCNRWTTSGLIKIVESGKYEKIIAQL